MQSFEKLSTVPLPCLCGLCSGQQTSWGACLQSQDGERKTGGIENLSQLRLE